MGSQLRAIFDIGMNNGDDTAFYLSKGFWVVGVEANPELVAQCRVRFAHEPRLTIISAGVVDRKDSSLMSFWVNETDHGWSSFTERGKQGGRYREIRVPCVTLDEIIVRHGVPYFLKVDVEGMDLQVLETLTRETSPQYLSCEMGAEGMLERLDGLGYHEFKIINQQTYTPSAPIYANELGWRSLRKVAQRVPIVRRAAQWLPYNWRAKHEFDNFRSRYPYPFSKSSSGPLPEETPGPWQDIEATREYYSRLQEFPTESLWYDIHARLRASP